MNRQKCEHCGFINGVSERTCRRCNKYLGPKWDPIDLNWRPPKQKRKFSIMPFVLVAVIAGGTYAFWQLRPEPEQSQPAVATTAANAKPAEKPILYAATEPANAGQASNGIRSTFEQSKALNDAKKRLEEANRLMHGAPANTKK